MPRVLRMGYVVLGTTDTKASAADLTRILGLSVTETSPTAICLSSSEKSCEVAYLAGDRPGVRAVGLEVADDAAVKEIEKRVVSAGFKVLGDTQLIGPARRAIRFATPFGPIFEIFSQLPRRTANAAADADRCLVHGLDHVNLRVNDPRAFHDFAIDVLGLRLSDRTTGFERAWYRAADRRHHTIAAAPGTGIHHFGFDAPRVENMIKAADNLVAADRTLLWGIGRHGPGNNIFSYYLEPNACVVEASFGMVQIADDAQAGIWDFNSGENVLDLWGSQPPESYAKALTPFIE
jgi:catechol 2,3-dioxygenase